MVLAFIRLKLGTDTFMETRCVNKTKIAYKGQERDLYGLVKVVKLIT
jgi:hypothetical protein